MKTRNFRIFAILMALALFAAPVAALAHVHPPHRGTVIYEVEPQYITGPFLGDLELFDEEYVLTGQNPIIQVVTTASRYGTLHFEIGEEVVSDVITDPGGPMPPHYEVLAIAVEGNVGDTVRLRGWVTANGIVGQEPLMNDMVIMVIQ